MFHVYYRVERMHAVYGWLDCAQHVHGICMAVQVNVTACCDIKHVGHCNVR